MNTHAYVVQGMLLVEAARLDGEAIRGNPPKDPGYFKVTANAIGSLAGWLSTRRPAGLTGRFGLES